MSAIDLLIVGDGMYVTGRGAPGYRGTILPAVFEARRAGLVGRVAIATTKPDSAAAAGAAALAAMVLFVVGLHRALRWLGRRINLCGCLPVALFRMPWRMNILVWWNKLEMQPADLR